MVWVGFPAFLLSRLINYHRYITDYHHGAPPNSTNPNHQLIIGWIPSFSEQLRHLLHLLLPSRRTTSPFGSSCAAPAIQRQTAWESRETGGQERCHHSMWCCHISPPLLPRKWVNNGKHGYTIYPHIASFMVNMMAKPRNPLMLLASPATQVHLYLFFCWQWGPQFIKISHFSFKHNLKLDSWGCTSPFVPDKATTYSNMVRRPSGGPPPLVEPRPPGPAAAGRQALL